MSLPRRVTTMGRLALNRRPIKTSPVEPSLLAPIEDRPSERLLDVALRAISEARTVDLSWLTSRSGDPYPDIWPGEHYKLLNALVTILQPKLVVEIGTATGLSALSMKEALPEDGKLVTFDVVRWDEFPEVPGMAGIVLRPSDFEDGRLEQHVDDLSHPDGWRRHATTLQAADFIFVDAKHDGDQERRFLRGFDEVGLARGPVAFFDDIRLWDMLGFWRDITRPKLDLTSFGHWSGTGLVDYA